jgi:WS/DGAT/MGAT family acyltransferase
MKPVRIIDAAFLQLETHATPMHVGAVFVLDPGSRAAARSFFRRFKAEIGAGLDRSEVFTRRVASLPFNLANPMWVDDRPELDCHVRRTTLPGPGSQRQLEDCVAELHSTLLDRDRPLWELHVIEGLADDRVALYIKTHHAGLDGASAQVFLQSFAHATPTRRRHAAGASPPPERVSTGGVLLHAVRHQVLQWARLPRVAATMAGRIPQASAGVRKVLAALAGYARDPAPRTPLNVAITGERSFASLEFPLAQARAVASRHEATINDVILCACAGALRRWLISNEALPVEPLRASVPFSTREPGNTDHSIQVSFMTVDLHTDLADPHRRLRAIHDSARESKSAASDLKTLIPQDLPSTGLPWLIAGLARAAALDAVVDRLPLASNVIISNVAGPPTPLYIGGARALTYSPVSIPYHGYALNVTVYSYDGRLHFGLTGARSALPDLRALAADLAEELRLLASAPRAGRPGRTRAAR